MTKKTKIMSDLEGLTFDDWHMYHSDTEVQGVATDALEFLKKQPEIARCKDCRHSRYDGTGELLCCKHHGWHPEDWFCADGEVKQDVH